MEVKVISQQPPGGRCVLYTGYAEVLGQYLGESMEVVFSAVRESHGDGFPSLWLAGAAVQPEDGVILMPGDIVMMLSAHGVPDDELVGIAAALEGPLERMLEAAE